MATVNCKPVHNLKFGSTSANGIKNIQHILDDSKIVSGLLMAGTFHLIFTRSNATWQVGLNVGMSDWEGLAKAAGDWNAVVKALVIREARNLELLTNGQEQVFWGELVRCLEQY
ncbi:hypothetical protein MTZ49_01130 [Entomomonas sp. E2T0]|uniref:hypothetical protein n=1 Tax=Entomomonas sp. E2T0 TaxID=2930213 RepID=UPI00222827EE|nr:hypothetical protein [Entomomonas sp. E2T0]UYZ84212.1 hypothetical protein MTZ49_01130 [Entomomonas sp. E2T0]